MWPDNETSTDLIGFQVPRGLVASRDRGSEDVTNHDWSVW